MDLADSFLTHWFLIRSQTAVQKTENKKLLWPKLANFFCISCLLTRYNAYLFIDWPKGSEKCIGLIYLSMARSYEGFLSVYLRYDHFNPTSWLKNL